MLLSLRIPLQMDTDVDEQKVREITDENEGKELIAEAFKYGTNGIKKVTLEGVDDGAILTAASEKDMYFKVVDFDDHMEDVSLDFMNSDLYM